MQGYAIEQQFNEILYSNIEYFGFRRFINLLERRERAKLLRELPEQINQELEKYQSSP